MQGIEQEVWLQLTLQRLQTRLCQLDLELGGTNLTFSRYFVIGDRLGDEDDRQVHTSDIVEHVLEEKHLKLRPLDAEHVGVGIPNSGHPGAGLRVPDCVWRCGPHRYVDGRECDSAGKMEERTLYPIPALHRIPDGNCENER